MTTLVVALTWASISWADERPRTIDLAEALELELPAQHDPFEDCDCVGLAWNGPQPMMLDIPATEISEFRHVVGDSGVHALTLVTVTDQELQLERAPCAFIAAQAHAYEVVLERPVRLVDESGAAAENSCAAPMQSVVEWDEERQRNSTYEVVQHAGVSVASLQVAAKGRDTDDLEAHTQREWANLRPRMGHCWAREQQAAPRGGARVRLVAEADGSVSGVKVAGRGTGSDRVDDCLTGLLDTATLRAPPVRATRLSLEVAYDE